MAKQPALPDPDGETGAALDLNEYMQQKGDLPELANYEFLGEILADDASGISGMEFGDFRELLSEEGERAFLAALNAEESRGEEIDSGFAPMKKAELFEIGGAGFRFIAWEFSIRPGLEDGTPKLTVEAYGKLNQGDKPFRLVDSTYGIAHQLYNVTRKRLAAGKDVKAAHAWLVVPGGLSQRPNKKNPTQPLYRMEFHRSEQD